LLFSVFFPRLLCLFLLQDSRWKRETYAREAEMSFLSSLVLSPSATQGLKERQKTCGQPDCRRLAPRSASDRTVRFSGAAQPP
jgi:hypothetical protein